MMNMSRLILSEVDYISDVILDCEIYKGENYSSKETVVYLELAPSRFNYQSLKERKQAAKSLSSGMIDSMGCSTIFIDREQATHLINFLKTSFNI